MKNNRHKRGRPSLSRAELYRMYKAEYRERAKAMRAKGLQMFQQKLTQAQFSTMYDRLKNSRLEEIEEGKRKTVGNIVSDLVKKQQYEVGYKQAVAYKKAMLSRTGEKLDFTMIRTGEIGVNWDTISAYQKELRDQGFSWKDVNLMVSSEFFGS